jgi:hypothetical protein
MAANVKTSANPKVQYADQIRGQQPLLKSWQSYFGEPQIQSHEWVSRENEMGGGFHLKVTATRVR